MMRSMFSGVSGLRVHQTKMDVIANNISNVNTMGFKSSRVTFADIFSQTTQSAARGYDETGRGGTNPMQIGLGATVASIDLQMTQGAAQRTDNPYDIMIQGTGFFIVSDVSGTYFSRAGAFNLDEAGNLVNPSGMKLMGWPRTEIVNDDGVGTGQYYIKRGPVQPIKIADAMRFSPPKQTSNIKFEDNLNAGTYVDPVMSTIAFYDSLGNRFTTEVYFSEPTPGADVTTWNWSFRDPSGAATDPIIALLDGDPEMAFLLTPSVAEGTISFNTNGIIVEATPPDSEPTAAPFSVDINFTLGTLTAAQGGRDIPPPVSNLVSGTTPNPNQPPPNLTNSNLITFDFTNVTQFGEKETNVKSYTVDGYAPGNLINVSISPDGTVNGLYSNGQMQILWQVVVANFRNPAGLEKFGDNLYLPTPNSGEFDGIGEAVMTSGGKLMGGVLEMSNVDLAQEFTEMITTQRGFQANSRIITVSDDMLAELVNLKR